MEQLPEPDVKMPHTREAVRMKLSYERSEWLGALASDDQRGARQAKANLDKLLDYFPSGTPRDFIVQYRG